MRGVSNATRLSMEALIILNGAVTLSSMRAPACLFAQIPGTFMDSTTEASLKHRHAYEKW